ncbi:meta-pathway phenol degradation-like protein [Sporocytophaga myxococcoides]|uniref:Meta-pathway phenol degradation-like protein n=1 Tax=Sporocytophaga myxococcoides TaxID=153721 RepID=A0A098LI19_9BACT|nr:transporter [Sporocytophaga myxococcoides]GAL86641.1 meta-pathway phenol degradation-like protein [Sporocytophaga myxococcoides]
MRKVLRTVFIISVLVFEFKSSAKGQQNFLPGFAGLMCGSQSDPGIYAVAFGWGMNVKKVADRNGKTHFFPNGDVLLLKAPALSLVVATRKKILGGNYSFSVTGAICNSRLEIPNIIGASKSYPYGITSTYIQPISLGWKTSRADFIAGYAVYLPTGKWVWLGQHNYGLGMWTQEINLGTTIYLNHKKSIHFAIEANYDINSKKRGVSYRTGWPLTLQGGLGTNYGNPDKLLSGWLGVAGFAQWITVKTKFNSDLGPIDGPYAHIYGLGPELVVFKGGLTFRYLMEFGAKSNYLGPIWCVTLNWQIKKLKA